VLAVSSPQRIAQLPKVPTFAELGMKELTSQEWIGLLAPKGTKPEVAPACTMPPTAPLPSRPCRRPWPKWRLA
jgi:hypothetical protein